MNQPKQYTIDDNVKAIMFTLKKMLAELEIMRQAIEKKSPDF